MLRAELWEDPPGRWNGRLSSDPPKIVTAGSRGECLDRLLDSAGGDPDAAVVIEERPRLVGVAEAAAILGWDKRRVITYVDRGRFPEPLARLAGGRVWRREDVQAWADAWKTRRTKRKGPGP